MSSKKLIRETKEILSECTFSLPETDPMGEPQEDIHKEVEEALLKEFGGFRVHTSEDYYMDSDKDGKPTLLHDETLTYTVFLPNNVKSIRAVKLIAIEAGFVLEQDFVSMKQPNGEAVFLNTAYAESN